MTAKKNMIDMSLDEIAQREGNKLKEDLSERDANSGGVPKRKPPNHINRRESGGPMRRSPQRLKRDAPYIKRSSDRDEKWVHDRFEHLHGSGPRTPRVQNTPLNILWGTMVVIDNLKYDVLEDDLRDLMEPIGPVESIKISYDSSGRSLGKAGVVFRSKYDAEQAVKEYHGVDIDGQKMKVEIGSKVKIVSKDNLASSWRGNNKPGRSKDDRGREDHPLKEERRRNDDKPNESRKDRPREPYRDRKDDRSRQNHRDSYPDRSSRDNNRSRDEKPRDELTLNQPKTQDS